LRIIECLLRNDDLLEAKKTWDTLQHTHPDTSVNLYNIVKNKLTNELSVYEQSTKDIKTNEQNKKSEKLDPSITSNIIKQTEENVEFEINTHNK